MIGKIAALLVALAVLPIANPVHTRQAEKLYRIDYLTPTSVIFPAFRHGLRKLGYVEGKNLAIEFRQRKRPKPYLVLAKELVALDANLRTPKTLGVTIPPLILPRATEVVE